MRDNAGAAFTLVSRSKNSAPSGVSPPGRPAHRIDQGWRRKRPRQGMPFDLARVGVPYQQISLMVDVAANGVRTVRRPGLSKLRPCGRETGEIIPRHLAKPLLLTGVEGGHEMACEMGRQHPAVKRAAPFIVEHRCKRPQRRLVSFAHCHEADHPPEHKPGGWFTLTPRRPGETRPADKPTVDTDGIGPIKADRLLGRCDCGQGVAERAHSRVDGAPRGPQRFIGLQHHGQLRKVEAPDMNQCPGTLFRRNGDRVSEGIADLTQHHRPERRRQIKPWRNWRAAADFDLCRHVNLIYQLCGRIPAPEDKLTTKFDASVSRTLFRTALLGLGAALGGAALALSGAMAAEVTFERLANPEPGNWLMNHHDYGSPPVFAPAAPQQNHREKLQLVPSR